MASGLQNCHPVTREALEDLGVGEDQVTQAFGLAPASAGFHSPEGRFDGKRYSSCVDLTWGLASTKFFHRMADAGFAVFFRDWPGNRHIHAVHVGLKDSKGKCRILPGPRQQIIDWTRGLNGLVGHAQLVGPYKPTKAEQEELLEQYKEWVPDYATTVYSPENKPIRCYAFLEGKQVCCDANAFLQWWGYSWEANLQRITGNGEEFPLDYSVSPEMVGGQFYRGPLRPLAEAIGLTVAFDWNDAQKTSCSVQLGYS